MPGYNIRGDEFFEVQEAIEVCQEWKIDHQYMRRFTTERKVETIGVLRLQLQEVDYWLMKNGGKMALENVRELVSEFGFHEDGLGEDVEEEADSRTPSKTSVSSIPGSVQSEEKNDAEHTSGGPVKSKGKDASGERSQVSITKEGIKQILIYRALLVGTLLGTILDNTEVWSTPRGQRVIYLQYPPREKGQKQMNNR